MPASSATFLFGLVLVTVAVAALCFFAYDASASRTKLRRRLELLPLSRDEPNNVGGAADTMAYPGTGLTLSGLQGDELEFARRLEPFHVPGTAAPQLLLLLRLFLGVGSAALLLVLGYRLGVIATPGVIAAVMLGTGCGWLIPHVLLDRLAKHRRAAVARGLAGAVELLAIAVQAGLSLGESINRVVVELRRSQPATAAELALTSADLSLLGPDEALRRLAERVDLPSLHSVVAYISQTLRYGTPLVQALRGIAAELREDALLRQEARIARMPVLLTIPMVLLILPSVFLIIGGPAFLRILDIFLNMRR